MTGTSLDGLDAALVEIKGCGPKISAHFAGLVSRPLGTLHDLLRALATGEPRPALDFVSAARRLGELHAEAVSELCAGHLPRDARLHLVVAHGQTIWHAPDGHRGDENGGVSWQLFDPWPLVRCMKVPVLYDLRQADLIAGGQGAPITPLADAVLYQDQADLIVNLGGICNVTVLAQMSWGYDLCPCNLLIDRVVQTLWPDLRFDRDGCRAASGHAVASMFESLVADLPADNGLPRSMGRESYCHGEIERIVCDAATEYTPCDIVASAVEAVAQVIAAAIHRTGSKQVVLAGGGTGNQQLVDSIRGRCGPEVQVRMSDDFGIPSQAREAVCFAVLGALSEAGIPVTQAQTTGAKDPGRAGVWAYP